MLQIAANWIEQEKKDITMGKEAYMAENCPFPDLSGDQAALMVRWWDLKRNVWNAKFLSFTWCSTCHQELCKKIHAAIDKIDESRYDIEAKVQKADIEVWTEKLSMITDHQCWETEEPTGSVLDWGPEAEGGGTGRREEACSEEGTDVGWRHAAGTAGREA